jgi:hypothetical protein
MGMTIASILSAILLLVVLFLAGTFLWQFSKRYKDKPYFILLASLSIIVFATLLWLSPMAWFITSILLSGENFNR